MYDSQGSLSQATILKGASVVLPALRQFRTQSPSSDLNWVLFGTRKAADETYRILGTKGFSGAHLGPIPGGWGSVGLHHNQPHSPRLGEGP